MTEALHVGQVALILGIPRRRVQWWIERGFLHVEPDPGYRRGHYWRVTEDEIRVARAVVKFQEKYRVRASAQLFEHMRRGDGEGPTPPVACANF